MCEQSAPVHDMANKRSQCCGAPAVAVLLLLLLLLLSSPITVVVSTVNSASRLVSAGWCAAARFDVGFDVGFEVAVEVAFDHAFTLKAV